MRAAVCRRGLYCTIPATRICGVTALSGKARKAAQLYTDKASLFANLPKPDAASWPQKTRRNWRGDPVRLERRLDGTLARPKTMPHKPLPKRSRKTIRRKRDGMKNSHLSKNDPASKISIGSWAKSAPPSSRSPFEDRCSEAPPKQTCPQKPKPSEGVAVMHGPVDRGFGAICFGAIPVAAVFEFLPQGAQLPRNIGNLTPQLLPPKPNIGPRSPSRASGL